MTTVCKARLSAPVLLLAGIMLSGCSTSKEEMMPAGENDMMAVWQGKTEVSAGQGAATETARAALRRGLTPQETTARQGMHDDYTRTQATEIHQQFPRLPNPDMVMYVFAHISSGGVPVPGYSTVFPFYHQVQYALPGERVEAL